MKDKYTQTFSENKNRSAYYENIIQDFTSQLNKVYIQYKDYKFDNINPRLSQVSGDNALRPTFVSVNF